MVHITQFAFQNLQCCHRLDEMGVGGFKAYHVDFSLCTKTTIDCKILSY